MTDLLAIKAFDDRAVNLVRFFRALGSHMTKLLTIATFDDATVDWLASILQSLGVLLSGRPALLLLGARRFARPSPCNAVLFVQITLKIH